jgi:hypothetical protein
MDELNKALFGYETPIEETDVTKVTDDEKLLYETTKDIVLWAESTLMDVVNPDSSLTLRYYQKEMLQYQPLPEITTPLGEQLVQQRKKLYRIGRQCLTGDAIIATPNGKIKYIKDIKSGDEIYSINENLEIEKDKVINKINNGEKEVYKITTVKGNIIKCTYDHKFLVNIDQRNSCNMCGFFNRSKNVWLSIKDGLKISDWIIIYESNKTNFDAIKSIQYFGIEHVYDIEVEKNHTFIANNIVTHNCGKTVALAVEILYLLTMNPNYKILCITPYESQCDTLFKYLQNFVETSPLLEYKRFVKKPYVMEMHNGSSVRAFTAGARSGQKGGSIRSASADCVVIDECDQGIDDTIIEVVMPIFNRSYRNRIIVSSTPTGRHGLYYEWSTNKKLGFKEFYYPSSVSTEWNSESEKFARSICRSQAQYDHEYLAIFGEQEEGVFKNSDLLASEKPYEYKDWLDVDGGFHKGSTKTFNTIDNYYIGGVDWNEKKGASIVIIERPKTMNVYRIFYAMHMPKSEYTQLAAVEKVIELDKTWSLNSWYVDQGNGSTNIELLQKYGDEGNRLFHKRLEAIDFGGNIIVYNKITKKKEKKPAKPFMVNNTVGIFEDRLISIPESEDGTYGIIGQARNYRVKNMNSTSMEPTYTGEDNDHLLCALFLGLLGMTMRYGDPSMLGAGNSIISKIEDRFVVERAKVARQAKEVKNFRTLQTVINGQPQFNRDNSSEKLNGIISKILPGFQHKRVNHNTDNIKRSTIGRRVMGREMPRRKTF